MWRALSILRHLAARAHQVSGGSGHGFGALLTGKLGGMASTVTVGILVPTAAVGALVVPPSAVKRLAAPLMRAEPDVLGARALAKQLWRARPSAGAAIADVVHRRHRYEEQESASAVLGAAAQADESTSVEAQAQPAQDTSAGAPQGAPAPRGGALAWLWLSRRAGSARPGRARPAYRKDRD